MGFYKKIDESNIQEAVLSVHHPYYTLLSDQKDTYTYPVDGWTWYDSIADAYIAYGISTNKIVVEGDTTPSISDRVEITESTIGEILENIIPNLIGG